MTLNTELKNVWAAQEINAHSEIQDALKAIPIEHQAEALRAVKAAMLRGIEFGQQLAAGYLNDKKDYDSANAILQLGTKKV